MRKFFSFIMVALTLLLCIPFFNSCKDDVDRVELPPEPTPTSSVKPTVYTSNIDNTVKPGDDFFMYAIGSWWKKAEITEFDEGIVSFIKDDAQSAFNEKTDNIDSETVKIMASHAEDPFTNAEEDLEFIQQAEERVNSAQTKEELWKLMGELAAEGFQMPFKLISLAKNGKMGAVFMFDDDLNISSSISKDDSDEEGEDDDDERWETILRNPSLTRALQPIQRGVGTRGFNTEEWPMLVSICEGMGINPADAYIIADDFEEIAKEEFETESSDDFKQLQELETEELAELILTYIDDNLALCSQEYFEAAEAEAEGTLVMSDFMEFITERYLKYDLSHSFAEQYCTAQMKQDGEQMVRELKNAFKKRLEQNTWLSEGSKANVIEKLNAMAVNVAYPEWMDEGLVDLSGSESLLEDIFIARKTYNEIIKALTGMSVDKGSFHALIACFFDLTTFNAMYAPIYNSINIFPCWVMDPIFSGKMDNSIKYASATVFAHEITHGFDNEGANWDKYGDINSIWASEADKAEFERRTQLLVEQYNQFEVMPGVFANGEKTLPENIADLGGVEIALDAYTQKMKNDGATDNDIKQGQVDFFVAYANLWRAKYDASHISKNLNDPEETHSLEKERVNGIVSNTDEWYELFDVKAGDKLYRSPEQRAYIW